MLRRTVVLLLLLALVIAVALVIGKQLGFAARVTRGKIKVAGLDRSYLLYVPRAYDPSRPTPLVISLHGFASWPANQMAISQWNELADQHGFLVVYPSGTRLPKRWNTSGSTGGQAADDVAFISALIDRLSEQLNVDPKRIYANGLSNGGGMANLLGCVLADRIAAIGGVAGAYTEPSQGCQPARPVPVIAFHGTSDPIVPFKGGASGPRGFVFPTIADWAAAWAQRNGCQAEPEALPAAGEVSGVRYSGCNGSADVVFYTIEGGGHSWPGGGWLPEPLVGHTTTDIDASAVMWEFFQEHPLE